MIELWVIAAVAAAFFQNLRSALQKHLKGRLSTFGAGYSRFVYALPLVGLYLWCLFYFGDMALPEPNIRFFVFVTLGGLCQIIFTVFLLWMFSFQSFAVGTTFSKIEVVMVAITGALILGDELNLWAIVAIIVSVLGVVTLSIGQQHLGLRVVYSSLFSRQTLIGLACAVWLGGSAVFFRGAALALSHPEFLIAAAFTLFISLVIQTIVMGSYLLLREPGELTRVFHHWRQAGAAGLTGALASVGWFTAFTLENASYVRAVGQIELVFTFIATTMFFHEKVSVAERIGIALVVAGILLLLLFA